ncbi:SHQ1 protein-domain-containing protein [Mycena rebaudengoi]|nr:SHQ1 protein-domain-containing protein [Mycena rebaudengoi]
MLTPRFECSQTDESVVTKIFCPSIHAADVEIHVDDTLFTTHINPYFLRLNFRTQLNSVTWTSSPNSLAPRPSHHPPLIKVISQEEAGEEDYLVSRTNALSLEHDEILQATENDWQLPQHGFLNSYSGYFKHISHTENEVNELGADTETYTPRERRSIRLKHEDDKADYVDDDYIQEPISWRNPIAVSTGPLEFSEAENLCITQPASKRVNLYLTLVTILFSYAYEMRTNLAPYCLLTISPSPVPSPDLASALSQSYRQCLSFPLYRSFSLAEACRTDVAELFLLGKRTLVRCLLETKDIVEHHEIWLEDFCVWVQAYTTDDSLREIWTALTSPRVPKGSIGRDLKAVEAATREVQERESDSDDESDDEAEVAQQL